MGRVLVVPYRSAESAVTRLRGHAFADELARRGFETKVLDNPIPIRWTKDVDLAKPTVAGVRSLLRQLRDVRRGDVLYLVRVQDLPLVPQWAVARARAVGARIVYDFDDAVHLEHPVTTRFLCRAADKAVVATEGMSPFAARWARSHAVVFTPYVPSEFPPPAPDPDERVVGWMGTPSNLPYLGAIKPTLEAVLRETGAAFRLITRPVEAAKPHAPAGATIIPWDLATYRAQMAKFHVGVGPLPDDAWTRGKLGTKVVEYQACGVPSVGGRVMAKDQVIVEGETGYYADSPAEWREAITRILTDDDLRRSMSKRALAHAEARFSVRAAGDRLAPLVEELMRR